MLRSDPCKDERAHDLLYNMYGHGGLYESRLTLMELYLRYRELTSLTFVYSCPEMTLKLTHRTIIIISGSKDS